MKVMQPEVAPNLHMSFEKLKPRLQMLLSTPQVSHRMDVVCRVEVY